MKINRLPALGAGLLMVAGGIWAFRESTGNDHEVEVEERKSAASSRSGRVVYSAESSYDYVAGFQNRDYRDAPSFADLEARMGQLTDQQLFDLLEKLDPQANFVIWMHAAIWAELGRRDHTEAFERLLNGLENQHWSSPKPGLSHAAFAYLRGRVDSLHSFEQIRDGVFPQIEELESKVGREEWHWPILARVFKRLAEVDPEQSWPLVMSSDWNGESVIMLSDSNQGDSYSRFVGFVRGLNNEDDVREFLKKWQTEVETPEYRKVYLDSLTTSRTSFGGFRDVRLPPMNEYLISHALGALARFNLEAAQSWFQGHQIRPGIEDSDRLTRMWQSHAAEFPNDAVQHLSDPDLKDHHVELALGIASRDHSQASEVISLLEGNAEAQGRVLKRLINQSTGPIVVARANFGGVAMDEFPVPDRYNRIPNFEERYEQLLEAIDLSEVTMESKEAYREQLDRKFETHLKQDP